MKEDFGSRIIKERIAKNEQSPLKNRRAKGKGGLKEIRSTAKKNLIDKFKRKFEYFKGASIVMNDVKNADIKVIPE